jgi:hypothetical protein
MMASSLNMGLMKENDKKRKEEKYYVRQENLRNSLKTLKVTERKVLFS